MLILHIFIFHILWQLAVFFFFFSIKYNALPRIKVCNPSCSRTLRPHLIFKPSSAAPPCLLIMNSMNRHLSFGTRDIWVGGPVGGKEGVSGKKTTVSRQEAIWPQLLTETQQAASASQTHNSLHSARTQKHGARTLQVHQGEAGGENVSALHRKLVLDEVDNEFGPLYL